jgi:PadR family transcriptional regulator, regulatory protein AphA
MDSQTLCLGILTLGPASGYDIRKQVAEAPFAKFFDASLGAIYPALAKLTEAGCVTCSEEAQDGRPDKKVYTLTPKGERAFREALQREPAADRVRSEAAFQLFFAEYLGTERLEDVLDIYHARFVEQIEHIRALDNSVVPPGRRFVRGLGLAFYEAMARYIEENRDELLAEERARAGEAAE